MQIRRTNALKSMMTEHPPEIENLTASPISSAIRYLEQDLGSSNNDEDDPGVAICACLYIVLFVGLALWLWR